MLALGGDGIISVASNEVPDVMAGLCAAAFAGDWATARALHERYLALMRVNFISPNPVPVKAAMAEMGLIHDVLRLPLLPMAEPGRAACGRARRPRSAGRAGRRRSPHERLTRRRPRASAALRRVSSRPAAWPATRRRPGRRARGDGPGRRRRAARPAWSSARPRRRAGPAAPGGWRANPWVKPAILLAFRLPGMTDDRDGPIMAARDRSALGPGPPRSRGSRAAPAAGAPWRVVPGGTTVRRGVHLEPGVTIMPPAYLNIGAWVGEGTMVDSHALVGSCAQVGRGVHLSAAAQVGGVLEPAGARPVVVEDDAFVGGGCGLYEGVVIGRGAVLGAASS